MRQPIFLSLTGTELTDSGMLLKSSRLWRFNVGMGSFVGLDVIIASFRAAIFTVKCQRKFLETVCLIMMSVGRVACAFWKHTFRARKWLLQDVHDFSVTNTNMKNVHILGFRLYTATSHTRSKNQGHQNISCFPGHAMFK